MKTEHQANSIAKSILHLNHVVFDKISFSRHGFMNQDEDETEVKLKMGVSIKKDSIDKYRVSLQVLAEKEEEYSVEIQVTGYCSIAEDCDMKDMILKKNAVAILFPYVRAQLTLITSQPETEPIVLPVLNISAIIDTMDISIQE